MSEECHVVDLFRPGEQRRTGFELRRRWREIRESFEVVPFDEVLRDHPDLPAGVQFVDPEKEEQTDFDASLRLKAMPVLRHGPSGWYQCQLLLATYHQPSVKVLVRLRVPMPTPA
jgi:hypothetical protein